MSSQAKTLPKGGPNFGQALKDGVISSIEIRQILSAHRAYVAARHEEVAAVIILHQE